jgi:hypothetical protein
MPAPTTSDPASLVAVTWLVPTAATLARAATGMRPVNSPARSTPSRATPEYQATKPVVVTTRPSQARAKPWAPVGRVSAAGPSTTAAATASRTAAAAQT